MSATKGGVAAAASGGQSREARCNRRGSDNEPKRIKRAYHIGHSRSRHSVAQQTRNLGRLLLDRMNERVCHNVANLGTDSKNDRAAQRRCYRGAWLAMPCARPWDARHPQRTVPSSPREVTVCSKYVMVSAAEARRACRAGNTYSSASFAFSAGVEPAAAFCRRDANP